MKEDTVSCISNHLLASCETNGDLIFVNVSVSWSYIRVLLNCSNLSCWHSGTEYNVIETEKHLADHPLLYIEKKISESGSVNNWYTYVSLTKFFGLWIHYYGNAQHIFSKEDTYSQSCFFKVLDKLTVRNLSVWLD